MASDSKTIGEKLGDAVDSASLALGLREPTAAERLDSAKDKVKSAATDLKEGLKSAIEEHKPASGSAGSH